MWAETSVHSIRWALGPQSGGSDMRLATFASALAIMRCGAVFGAISWQTRPVRAPEPAQAPPTEGRAPVAAVRDMDNPAAGSARAAEAPAALAQAAAPLAALMPASCSNPDALGVSRVVEIDTTGGPGSAFAHFKAPHFLSKGEAVVT